VHARKVEELGERARGAGRRADEPENNFIGVYIASVGHVYSDVAQHWQSLLLN
jgi:hypothetical protein